VIVPGASGPIAGDPDEGVETIPVLLAAAADTVLSPLMGKAFENPDVTVVTVCGGSVLLAMAGLIDDRHAATPVDSHLVDRGSGSDCDVLACR
jgi:putative intracellular protease/amidase